MSTYRDGEHQQTAGSPFVSDSECSYTDAPEEPGYASQIRRSEIQQRILPHNYMESSQDLKYDFCRRRSMSPSASDAAKSVANDALHVISARLQASSKPHAGEVPVGPFHLLMRSRVQKIYQFMFPRPWLCAKGAGSLQILVLVTPKVHDSEANTNVWRKIQHSERNEVHSGCSSKVAIILILDP